MALNAFLAAKCDNTDVKGTQGTDNTITAMGAEDTTEMIQVVQFESAVNIGSATTGNQIATSGRLHAPTTFHILLGASFVHIEKALRLNQRFDGIFKFFRNNADTGATELAYTYTMTQGRVVGLRVLNANTMDSNTSNYPLMAEVRTVAHQYTYEADGVTDDDIFASQSA